MSNNYSENFPVENQQHPNTNNNAYGSAPPPQQQQQQQAPWHGNVPPPQNYQPQHQQHQPPAPGQYDPAAKPQQQQQQQHPGGNIYAQPAHQTNQNCQPHPGQQQHHYQHQPQHAPYVAGGPGTNAYGYPPSADFQAELCGCFNDCSACLEGWLCAYCQVAAQFNKVEHGESDVYWPACLGAYCLDVCCGWSGVALCILNMMVRSKIRSKYNIQPAGQEIYDCCVSCYCRCCAITQQYHELTARGAWPGGILVQPPTVMTGQMGAPVTQATPLVDKRV